MYGFGSKSRFLQATIVNEATITIATKLLRTDESRIIRKEKRKKSLTGFPLLYFKNFIAENSKIFASSAAVVIIKVPINIKITSSSMKLSAISYEKILKNIPANTIPIAPIIAARVLLIFSVRIRK
jgi:hypothetical protein